MVHSIPCTKCINELVYMRNTQFWISNSLPYFLSGGGSSHVWMETTAEWRILESKEMDLFALNEKWKSGMDKACVTTYFSSNFSTVFSSWQQFFFFSFRQQGGSSDCSSWQWFCWLMKNEVKTPSSSQACVNTGIPMFPKNNSALKKIRISGFTLQRYG